MPKLILGKNVGDLGVEVVPGEPWTCTRRLTTSSVVDGQVVKVPYEWPAVPILYFPELDMTITGSLSPDEADPLINSMATWIMTSQQTVLLETGYDARLQLNGESFWMGEVTCRS